MENKDSRVRSIYRVTLVGFAVNLLLSLAKLAAGIFGRSAAMVADAVHSISDFVTDCVVLFFVRISSKPKDKDHAYGHGKYETMASIIIALAVQSVSASASTEPRRLRRWRVARRLLDPSLLR